MRQTSGTERTPFPRGRVFVIAAAALAALLASSFASGSIASAETSGRPTLVPGSYRPGKVIVRFRDDAAPASMASAHAAVGGRVLKTFVFVRNLQVVRLGEGVGVADAIASYRARSDVLYAEPDLIWRIDDAELTPNDPLYASMYNLNNTGQTGGTPDADIDAPEAWDLSTGSSAVVVGSLDTGVDYNHDDLRKNTKPNTAECNGTTGIDDDGNGYVDDCHGIDPLNGDTDPIDDNGHGTHTNGTIGAVGNNSKGVTGINWNVQIIACKTHDPAGNGDSDALLECLQYMEIMKSEGLNVVATNNSYGGCPEACGFSQALEDAIASNMEAGILFVASAGNDIADNDVILKYPADYFLPNVIAVAATDEDDDMASFSNYGDRTVSVGAPGDLVRSTLPGNSYGYLSGTSMAGPHVTGLAALLEAQNPSRSWKAIRNLILTGGDKVASLTGKTITGRRINAFKSMTCSNRKQFAHLRPLPTVDGTDPVVIAALNIKCARAAGSLTVQVSGGPLISLLDNGLGADLAKRDGIYSATWTPSPCTPGVVTLNYSNGKTANFTLTC